MKTMIRVTSALVGALFMASAGSVSATPITGLSTSVWHNVAYSGNPLLFDVSVAWNTLNSRAPDYTFVNANTGFSAVDNAGTIRGFLGADAAGAALSDNTGNSYWAFEATGFIYAPVAGAYTYTINRADDILQIAVDGVTRVQQNYRGELSPGSAVFTLSQGFHSFDLRYLQGFGGSNLSLTAAGPGGAAVQYTVTAETAVPEPASALLLIGGMVGLLALRRRKDTTEADGIAVTA